MVMGGLLVILSKSEKLGRGGGRSGGGGGFCMLLKQLPNMGNDELPLWSFYQK